MLGRTDVGELGGQNYVELDEQSAVVHEHVCGEEQSAVLVREQDKSHAGNQQTRCPHPHRYPAADAVSLRLSSGGEKLPLSSGGEKLPLSSADPLSSGGEKLPKLCGEPAHRCLCAAN